MSQRLIDLLTLSRNLLFKIIIIFLSGWMPLLLWSQPVNLVPNPGFEDYRTCPTGMQQIYRAIHWTSPTAGTPDYYHACFVPIRGLLVDVPDNKMGYQTAHTGEAYAGIIVINDPEPLIEYLMIKLLEPLVKDSTYCCEAYFSPADYCRFGIDGIGFYFSPEAVQHQQWAPLEVSPQIRNPAGRIIRDTKDWTLVSGAFKAKGGEQWLTIGHFKDRAAKSFEYNPAGMKNILSYYFIDDVSVFLSSSDGDCTTPLKAIPTDDLTPGVTFDRIDLDNLQEGQTFILDHVRFDFDAWTLLPASLEELDKLVNLLRAHPGMAIEIAGHTDSLGSESYNRELSQRRVNTVASYLIRKGIADSRLSFVGYGSSRPIDTNASREGRRRNRRVEFMIRKL